MNKALAWQGLAMVLRLSLSCFPIAAWAEGDLNQRLEEVKKLVEKGDEKGAIDLMQQIYVERPDNPSAALSLGNYHTQNQNYLESVRCYEEALRRFDKLPNVSNTDLAGVHAQLVNDYNELGQQKYFPPELCLRILYHMERWFHFNGKDSGVMEKQDAEFARKTIGHYDVAKMGPNVRMKEWNSQVSKGSAALQLDDAELVLPPDGISEEEKLKAKEAIAAQIRTFDQTRQEYQTTASDFPLDAVLEKLEASFQQMKTAHYVRQGMDQRTTEKIAQETWYQYPQMLKARVDVEGRGERWWIFYQGKIVEFDPKSRKILSQESFADAEMDWLSEIRKPNSKFLRQRYVLDVQKLTQTPNFLNELYEDHPSPKLYLLTAKPKSSEDSWPPVVKEEFIVDLDQGLLVGFRQYWRGVMGSGRDEELATTDVVTQWKQFPGSLFLPEFGWTEQLVDEITDQGPGHRVVRAPWHVEIISVNAPINSSEFDLEGYTTESTGSAEEMPPRS